MKDYFTFLHHFKVKHAFTKVFSGRFKPIVLGPICHTVLPLCYRPKFID